MSNQALSDALIDMVKDIKFMFNRRNNLGLTTGKTAGAIVYRLSKALIIHTNDSTLYKDKHFLKLNSLVSLSTGFRFLGIRDESKIPKLILSEIVYSLNRRHVNQETLGLVFDMLVMMNQPNPI